MLPTVDGQRRAVLYGGVETSPQVLVVSVDIVEVFCHRVNRSNSNEGHEIYIIAETRP